MNKKHILYFKEIYRKDVGDVGGKNASLGEMFNQLRRKGIKIPDGFATTSAAYWYFIKSNNLLPQLKKLFAKLNVKNIKNLQKAGSTARNLILKSKFPQDLEKEIVIAYRKLGKIYGRNPDVAVRSSATAEDLPTAFFARHHAT